MSFIRPFQVSLLPPFSEQVSNRDGFVSPSWTTFFGLVTNLLNPLGVEKNFQLKNNLAVAEDIVGLSFNSKVVSQAVVDYYIQRVTNSNEVITSGTFHAVFKPSANNWALVTMGTPGPNSSGITFSISTAGQVQYTSSNVIGTVSISKITWRARTLAAKNSQYSAMDGA